MNGHDSVRFGWSMPCDWADESHSWERERGRKMKMKENTSSHETIDGMTHVRYVWCMSDTPSWCALAVHAHTSNLMHRNIETNTSTERHRTEEEKKAEEKHQQRKNNSPAKRNSYETTNCK